MNVTFSYFEIFFSLSALVIADLLLRFAELKIPDF